MIKESGGQTLGMMTYPASIGVSAGGSSGNVNYSAEYFDVNGDGLPDRVYIGSNGAVWVRYNLGYSFGPAVQLSSVGSFRDNSVCSTNLGGSVGYTADCGAFTGGIGLSWSKSAITASYVDMNGDGLPDRVSTASGVFTVAFNTGCGFMDPVTWNGGLTDSMEVSYDKTDVYNATVSYSLQKEIVIPVGVWIGDLIVNPSVGANYQITQNQVMLADMNGDGLPDHVKGGDSSIKVCLNVIGRTNLLKSVKRPLGSTITLDYERSKNSVQCPHSKWLMKTSTMSDGMGNSYTTTYSYETPIYDRKERESYGFAKVTQTQPDGSTVVKEYLNGSTDYQPNGTSPTGMYTKGLEVKETVRGANTEIATITENSYELVKQSDTSFWPKPVTKTTKNYAGISTDETEGVYKQQTERFGYDGYGNVTAYTREGDRTVKAAITYTNMTGSWIVGKPVKIVVSDASGTELRRRVGVYDSLGNLRKLTQSDSVEIELNYDGYGNIAQFIGPQNHRGQRYALNYVYDGTGMFVTSVTDSFGYTSKSSYDYRFGVPTRTTDINGSMIVYGYDEFGRQTKVYAPDDIGTALPTISMSYDIDTVPAMAVTKNKGLSTSSATIDTVTYIDGLKRMIQTRKQMEVGGTTCFTASGKIKWDQMGREISQGQPYRMDASLEYTPRDDSSPDVVRSTTTEYDGLGRAVKKIFPDGTSIQMAYALDNGMERTTTTDQNGHKKESYRDDSGNIVKVREYCDGDAIETTYEYDAMSQITKITDAKNNVTSCTYDELGRRLTIQNPDTGLTEYRYDAAGNMVGKVTPNVKLLGKSISYTYNYNRLEKIAYPQMNNVYYTYGAAGAANNGAGRIVSVDNGDVKETRKYGRLGEMTESTKTITSTSPTIKRTSYTTKYTWDSMGRLHRLVYPDGEILDYSYDNGGLLKKAVGTVGTGAISRAEGTTEYVKEILYDEFGQRTKMTLGNGDVTTYAYDPENRRMTNLKTVGSDSTVWQNLSYKYDDVGNITKINNEDYITCDAKAKTTTQSYSYDDLDRLVEANGSYSHETWVPFYTDRINSYTNELTYDSIGNILSKNQKNAGTYTDGSTKTLADTTYDWDYTYGSTRPHAVTQTGALSYAYDANGNMTTKTDSSTGKKTVFSWNEENRMTQAQDSSGITVFRYDDTGTRISKKGTNGETIYVNTNYSIKDEQLESTHIFAGQTRVATKLTMLTTSTTTTDMGVYYYHPDHIGSASTVTDKSGKFTEHCEYFPYGEVWISESASTNITSLLPFKFTGKELDPETGLYYYGARYMDPKLGRFVSVDPYLNKYLPTGDKQKDKKLPGNGGVFEMVNLNIYHYAAENPVMIIDPDGNHDECTQKLSKLFTGSGDNIIDKRALVTVKNGKVVPLYPDAKQSDSSADGADFGFDATGTQGKKGVGAQFLIRDDDGKMQLITVNSTSTGTRDSEQPRRVFNGTKTLVDENFNVVGKAEPLSTDEKNFVNDLNSWGDHSKIFNPNVITGYSESGTGVSTEQHPTTVQGWHHDSSYSDDKKNSEPYGK